MKEQLFVERECVHRHADVDGDVYNGLFFIKALQRLQSDKAVRMAGRIGSFYWVDAPRVLVWLCRQCATELHIGEIAPALMQTAGRQPDLRP